jgi:hypothetical protein
MTDNVVNFTKSKDRMPAGWRKHVEALKRTEAVIDVLRKRLKQRMRDFLDAMKEEMNPIDHLGNRMNISPDEQKVMATASWRLEKCAKDTLTLLECASERVGHATSADWCFEYRKLQSGAN